MNYKIWTPITIILIYLTNELVSLECITTNKCKCFESHEIEYQCPIQENPDVDVKVIDDSSISIQCINTSTPFLDIEILPELDVPNLLRLKVEYCYVNSSFIDMLAKFNARNITSLTLEPSAENNKDRTILIDKLSLKDLETLEKLSIGYSTLNLGVDFLENTPRLRFLSLNKNGLKNIDKYFIYVPKLEVLDLSQNQIETLPENVFEDLANLTKLHLWMNKLTEIRKEFFTNLRSLKLLELSSNQISVIKKDSFSELGNLTQLSLFTNKISKIFSNTFRNNSLLEEVRLSYNPGLVLSDHVFENLTALKTVDLGSNQLKDLPENTFLNCHNLQNLRLRQNNFTSLANKVFEGLKNLKRLDLSENKISSLQNEIFWSLKNLEILNLNTNELTTINTKVFEKLEKLTVLNLGKNKIHTIELTAFRGFSKSLTDLDLSYNQWNNTYVIFDASPLNDCLRLETLRLQNNIIDNIPDMTSLLSLRDINLSNNVINFVEVQRYIRATDFNITIDLRNNNISTVYFTNAHFLASENYDPSTLGRTILNINNNPITCDCFNFDLVQFNNVPSDKIRTFMDFKQDELFCAEDNRTAVTSLKPLDINCPLVTGCSCHTCLYRPYDKAAIMDCSFENLTSYPVIYNNISRGGQIVKEIVLNLTGNFLVDGPLDGLNYDNITYLDLSWNKISKISWIPFKLKELDLSGNNLKYLSGQFIEILKKMNNTIEQVYLKNNSWVCDCHALDLQKYLMQYYKKVSSIDVYCQDSKTQLVKSTSLCKPSTYLAVIISSILSVLLLLTAMFALYFRYQTEIKVYLYAKNLCLWFVTEEELDKDKKYDVFISYAHQDEKFVAEQLLPELEHGEHPFKVCIHVRDWIPGEFITKQVIESVKESRRTLVVLSNDFLDSVWGKLEFRTAHTEAMTEGRARVIVLIYGEINEDKLDEELKSYLKTNTYIKWGDKYFWNKLRYAMPHSKNHFYEMNTRQNKVMLKIDDKFNLIQNPPSPAHTSTPPITLDPTLLDSKQLKIDVLGGVEGEMPLLVQRS